MNVFKYLISFLIALSALTAGLLLYGNCKAEERTNSLPEPGSQSESEIQTIEAKPENYEVNQIPDAYFGKKIQKASLEADELVSENLTVINGDFPKWLESILSRESIVCFANEILAESPEELEFVQSSSKHYQGPGSWKAFKVMFNTRPSNRALYVYGAYASESESYWVSGSHTEAVSLLLNSLSVGNEEISLGGTLGSEPFKARIGKTSATIYQ